MNPRFSRGEYWILETAVTAGIPLSFLISKDIAEILNKPGYGFSHRKLWQVLESMSRRKLIKFDYENGRRVREVPDLKSKTLSNVFYRLTKLGGLQWEAFAAPNWDQFIDFSFTFGKSGIEKYTIYGVSKHLLQRYIEGLRDTGVEVDPSTIRWQKCVPFWATYWKKLAAGYRLTFSAHRRQDAAHRLGLGNRIRIPRWYMWG